MANLLKKYNPESIRISAYKTFDNKIFSDFALKPLVLKIGTNFYDCSRKQIMIKEAEKILFDYDNEVVLKEDIGFGGHGVNFIESRRLNFDHYAHLSSYIIQPVVCQHENLKAINDKSVNTLRVLTYLNGKGSIDVKYTELRFGTGKSRVDNTSSGGDSVLLNQMVIWLIRHATNWELKQEKNVLIAGPYLNQSLYLIIRMY